MQTTYSLHGFSENEQELIKQTLKDKRGWKSKGYDINYSQVSPDITIELQTNDQIKREHPSMDNMSYADIRKRQIVINEQLWNQVPEEYPQNTSLTEYRQYLINHEMGHQIRKNPFHDHPQSDDDTQYCPVMHQQYKGGCTLNPWVSRDSISIFN